MVNINGIVAAVYLAIFLFTICIVVFLIVGYKVIKHRNKVIASLYFLISPAFILIGIALTKWLHNPDFILATLFLLLFFNSLFLPLSKRYID